jgi:hypothetical protein
MIDPSNLHGKRLAMIGWAKKSDGKDDAAVFTGIAHWDGAVLTMQRGPETDPFEVSDEWFSRIRPVREDRRDMLLDADYFFSVSVGDLEVDEVPPGFRETGLKWPSGKKDPPAGVA